MGSSISLQSFKDKKIAKFPRSIVWSIFGPKARSTAEGWGLMYENGPGGVLYLDDDDFVDGCSIMSPSNNAIRDLYAVARRVPSAINRDADFFVANAAVIPGMPDWLLGVLPKPPRVVLSADALLQRLGRQ